MSKVQKIVLRLCNYPRLGSPHAPICVVSEYLPKSRPKYYRSPYCNSNHDGYNPTHSLGYKS